MATAQVLIAMPQTLPHTDLDDQLPKHSEPSASDPKSHSNGPYTALLPLLTLEEKVSLLSGASLTSTNGIERLGIPSLNVSDSINGVRGAKSHLEDTGTACFTSSTALASTWNPELMYKFGQEVGRQARLKDVHVVIGPNINMHRDPRGGRNFETFSEDPLLTGTLAGAIVRGVQEIGVGACVKHFVANESETSRKAYDVVESADGRTMREIYMRAFECMFRDSNPASVMMAYNKLDGVFCSENRIIKDVLRNEWQYDGCVMSDWYGSHSGAESLAAGLDLEMPGPSVHRGAKLVQAIREGAVSHEDLDQSVRNVLKMIDRSTTATESPIVSNSSSMARQTATEGIVLLKNERQTLPLDIHSRPSIAVIGAGAAKPVVTGGGSAAAHPEYEVSFLEALRKIHPEPESVQYATGVSPFVCTPTMSLEKTRTAAGHAGIRVEHFNKGDPAPVLTQELNSVQMVMLGRIAPGLDPRTFYSEVTTTLKVEESGRYTLGAQVTGGFALELDGETILQSEETDLDITDFLFQPKKLERVVIVDLEAGHEYQLKLRVTARSTASHHEPDFHSAKLVFLKLQDDEAAIKKAMAVAAHSDVAVIFAGRTGEHESEGFDLDTITLPTNQISLIRSVASVAPRTILILHHGNPIDISAVASTVDAIFAAHFPGQEGANALLDLITGETNPSGRLATTWPLKYDEHCIPTLNTFKCSPSTLQIKYEEGINVGYRHPDTLAMSRFSFGHGLGYSTFQVKDLKEEKEEDASEETDWTRRAHRFTVSVENTGSRSGRHAVQLYSQNPVTDASVHRPKHELVGFTKVFLEPGEQKAVEIPVVERDVCGTWDEREKCWKRWSGTYTFIVADGIGAIAKSDSACLRVEF
jgi:beta-glucosidase